MEKQITEALKRIMLSRNIEISKTIIAINGVHIVEDNTEGVAYTNGKGIFINKKYIKAKDMNLSIDNYIHLISHEALHILTFTFERRENRNHLGWNIATDYAINQILKDENIGKGINGILQDDKYRDMSAEQIYDELKQQAKQNSGGEGDGEEGEGEFQKGEGQAKINSGGNQIVMDNHSTMEGMSNEEKQSIQAKMNDIIKDCSKNGSSLMERIMNLRGVPKFNWKAFLSKFIKSFMISNCSWKMPSKRSIAINGYLPKIFKTQKLKVAVGIDTSGSIGDNELNTFFGHLMKVMSSYKDYEIDIHCFSTIVHENTIKTFKRNNSKELKNYKIESNCGTDIKKSFDYINNIYNRKRYDAFICMTDGYDEIDNLKFNKCPVVWAIIGDKQHNFKSPIKASVMFMDED